MKRFTNAGRQALKAGNWYSALALGLIIPEICASLEDPGPGKSQRRYETWARKWVQPRFTKRIGANNTEHVFISAEDLYQLRCSIIHSGSAEFSKNGRGVLDRVVFLTHGPRMNLVESGGAPGAPPQTFVQVCVEPFCMEIFLAAEEWDAAVTHDVAIQAEKANLLVIHEPGAIVGGVRFGTPARGMGGENG